MWEEGVPPGRTRSSPAPLANFFPGRGRGALERVGLGLLLVADLLVEAARDHLVGHRLGVAELGERFHLVRHHLVASRPDCGEHLFDRGRLLDHSKGPPTGSVSPGPWAGPGLPAAGPDR